MFHLELDPEVQGKQLPYCFAYSPRCGKCKKVARVRSTKDISIEGIPTIEILFQCDTCKLRWHLSTYVTKKPIRDYGPTLVEEGSKPEVTK